MEPPLKRKRPIVSCAECHRRKQKCNRQQPCSHCAKRGKADSCSYESPDVRTVMLDNAATYTNGTEIADPLISASLSRLDMISLQPTASSDLRVPSHLGYANNPTGTLGIIHRIGAYFDSTALDSGSIGDTVLQYKTLIRQLPPKRHIEKLVCFFFAEISWQYDIVDEETFRGQLCAWEQVSYAARSQPLDLSPTVRYFPALLFQVLAQALLFQPVRHDSDFNDLKHAPDMDLADLAAELSDAGDQIASMFGIRDSTIVRVQAGLHRACFQKTTGSVVEAWHTLGGAIRDAQELGLHRLDMAVEDQSPVNSEQAQHDKMGMKA